MTLKSALLVDDSKLARITLKKLLERHNLDVVMCASAQEALDYLKDGRPDVIFMDHLMPEMDGLEAMAKIKTDPETRHLPVVMCTGKEGDNYEETVKQAGAIGFLSKPPEPEHLERILSLVSSGAASTPAPEATVVAEVAPAVADTGEIRVQLDALEHKLLSALHERIDAVKAEFETHKADIVGAGAASDSDALTTEFHSKLEGLHSRTEEINALFAEFEARVGVLSSDVDSLRGEISEPTDQAHLLARLDALEATSKSTPAAGGITKEELPDAIRSLLPEVIEFSPEDLTKMRVELESIRSVVSDQDRESVVPDFSEAEQRIEQKVGQLVYALDEKLAASLESLSGSLGDVEEKVSALVRKTDSIDSKASESVSLDTLKADIEMQAGKAVEVRLESIFTQQQSQMSELRNSIRAEVERAVSENVPAESGEAESSQRQEETLQAMTHELALVRQQLASAQSRNLIGLVVVGGAALVALAKAFGAF